MQIQPARISPQRPGLRTNQPPTAQYKTYGPPTAGLVTNAPLASTTPNAAIVLENFRATSTGVEPRGGSNWRVSTAAAVKSLFQYSAPGSEAYFAADTSAIYTFTDATADETTLASVVSGQTSGDYSTVEMTTSGGTYLTAVNGADDAQIYDGTSWQTITAASSPIAITGIDTELLSDVWLYRSRQFFIEKNTMSAWYLGINSVGGAAAELPLAGVFNSGGALLFGGTLSSDSGAGLDDRCVFVTTEGEVAIYTGGDPSDPNDWSLNGVYDIGEPLGKHAHMRLGGDLIIGTKTGLIPLSAVLANDQTRLPQAALSLPIQQDWQAQVAAGGSAVDWRVIKRNETNEAYVLPIPAPSPTPFVWVYNIETGVWYQFTGWRADAIAILGSGLHFGGMSGKVYEGDVGGTDEGAAFVCQGALTFDDMGAPGALKTVRALRGVWQFTTAINPQHSVATDYAVDFPSAPSVATFVDTGGSLWDVALWDVALWGGSSQTAMLKQVWETVGKHGRAISVQFQVTSGASYKLPCELIAIDVVYATGATLA